MTLGETSSFQMTQFKFVRTNLYQSTPAVRAPTGVAATAPPMRRPLAPPLLLLLLLATGATASNRAVCADRKAARYCTYNHGKCDTDKKVQRRCLQTCGLCLGDYFPESLACQDVDAHKCARKFKKGKCWKRRMARKCPYTCNVCTGSNQGATVKGPVCACDKYVNGAHPLTATVGLCVKTEAG